MARAEAKMLYYYYSVVVTDAAVVADAYDVLERRI